nr:L-2-amino-thiazoline-4-carboxylic acid hydrolase [Candidatus Njordarchaeota archaeon]
MERPSGIWFVEEYKKWQRDNIEVIVAMLRSLRNLYGEKVINVASAAYLSTMRQRWRRIGEESEERDIGGLFKRLWENSKSLFSYEVIRKDENSLELKVNSCFWADEFRRLNAADIGFELCCMADFYIVEGFNPAIKYKRNKTLMKGDNYCDHHYAGTSFEK